MAEMFFITITGLGVIFLLFIVITIILYGIFNIDLIDIIISPWIGYKRGKRKWKEEEEEKAIAKEFEELYGVPYSHRYKPDVYSKWAHDWTAFDKYH